MDKLYVMASNESLAHFMRNPRPFLAPHLPCPPCKVCVLGPPHSGKTILAQSLAQRYNAKVKMGQQWYRSPFCKWFSHGLWRKAAFCIVVPKGSYQSPRIPYRGLIRHVVEGGMFFEKTNLEPNAKTFLFQTITQLEWIGFTTCIYLEQIFLRNATQPKWI